MQLFYIGIVRSGGEKALELASAKDLSSYSFFERSGVSQFMTFMAETLAGRTDPGQRQSIEEGNTYVGHVYNRPEGVAAVIIADREYPMRVAHSLCTKVLEEFVSSKQQSQWEGATERGSAAMTFPALDGFLKTYQDPKEADPIMQVQKELDETKIVLHKTLESVLHRGEKIDKLVDKSEALSGSAKMFYKQAKK